MRSPEYWSTIKKNAPPVAQSATLTMDQDLTLVGKLNATDDYDRPEQLRFAISSPPASGVVQLSYSTFTYTPDPGFWGSDSFTFKVAQPFCISDGVPSSLSPYRTVVLAVVFL